MNYQVIGFTVGGLLALLGLAELVPALLDWADGHKNAQSFFLSSMISIFFGGALLFSNKNFKYDMNIRQIYLLITLSWISISFFAALPLYISELKISFTDAFFEAVSGITTTSSTVLADLDTMSRGILFWRSMMQWLGGLAVVCFSLLLLPYLKIGGMQLIGSEYAKRTQIPLARIQSFITSLTLIYLGLTFACILAYSFFGMDWFDAVNHAFTTISTGGFSTHDASFAYFENSSLHYTAMLFMLSGAVPFTFYILLIFRHRYTFLGDPRIKSLGVMLLIYIGLILLWLALYTEKNLYENITTILFNVISIVTTTGYTSADYDNWGPFILMLFFFMAYIGACAGSTSGGLKIMRLIVSFKILSQHLKKLVYPSGVFAMQFEGHNINDKTAMAVLGFLGLYVAFNVALTAALALTGLDFLTAVSGAASAIANVGTGLGDIIGPGGNFRTLNDAAKWLLCVGMIVGRLEILTIAVFFSPRFWKS